jgi:NAD(P)-dependent dehydrogenase (short-subunit alcohol dehydrogenase family)
VGVLDLFSLVGQKALVTGAGGGLGRAFATALAEAGADVACVDVNVETANETADLVRATGRRAIGIAADLTREEDAVAMVAETVRHLGGLDIAFANAGVGERRFPLLEAPLSEWQRIIDLDLTGVFLTVREAAKVMVPQKRGKIVSTASIIGFVGQHEAVQTRAYAAAKGGVVNFTRSVAIELAPHNIQVNAIAPTYMRTNIAGGRLLGDTEESRQIVEKIKEHTPMGRIGEPEELKGVAVLLASAASSLMTGHTVVIDGGWLAW